MDTSQTDYALVRHPVVLRVLLMAGALFGFTMLAVLLSGVANASEGAPPPDRPGLLDRTGQAVHGVLEPAEPVLKPVTGIVRSVTSQVAPVLKPVTGTVHSVTSQVAPVLKPVTDTVHSVTSQVAPVLKPVTDTVYSVTSQVAPVLKPVTSGLEPVVAPLIRAVEPALQPVTQPVLHSLSPVTQPALHALSPVTQPATQPVPHTTAPVTAPWVHADWTATPAAAGKPALSQPRENAMVRVGQAVAHQGGALEGMAWHTVAASVVPMSGSGGGGSPADVSGMSGSMSASPGGQHGGEYAVTTTGTVTPGTDRTWRVPPGGRASLYWLVCYGNDHPS